MKLAIILEGGVVQAVVSNDPSALDGELLIIDYDTDGVDAADLTPIPQSDGSTALAQVFHPNVDRSEIDLTDL